MLTGVPFWLLKVSVTRTKLGVSILTLPPGALMDATLISFRALRLTVGVRSTPIGLTFIRPILISFPAKILTITEASILPVLTVPLLVKSTPTPCKLPAVTFCAALKLIFSVASTSATITFPALLLTSTATPRKFPAFTSPDADKLTFLAAVALVV